MQDKPFNILICLELIPDVKEIRVKKGSSSLNLKDVPLVINPPDIAALHTAFKIKEEDPPAKVYTLTMGPESLTETISKKLSGPVDKAFLVSGKGFGSSDASGVAYILSKAIETIEEKEKLRFDLFICGGYVPDSVGQGQVGPYLAEDLNIKQYSDVKTVKFNEKTQTLSVTHTLYGGSDLLDTPCLITMCSEGKEESLTGEKGVPVTVIRENDLKELDRHRYGIFGSAQTVSNIEITGHEE